MLEYLGTLIGMHQVDSIISSAEAAENKPKQVQTAPPPEQLCSFKEPEKIRECLDRKFKDNREAYPEMWDKDWIKKP